MKNLENISIIILLHSAKNFGGNLSKAQLFPDAGPSLVVTQQTASHLFIISNKVSTIHSPAFFLTKKSESIAEVITIGNHIRTVTKLSRNGVKWAIGQ